MSRNTNQYNLFSRVQSLLIGGSGSPTFFQGGGVPQVPSRWRGEGQCIGRWQCWQQAVFGPPASLQNGRFACRGGALPRCVLFYLQCLLKQTLPPPPPLPLSLNVSSLCEEFEEAAAYILLCSSCTRAALSGHVFQNLRQHYLFRFIPAGGALYKEWEMERTLPFL